MEIDSGPLLCAVQETSKTKTHSIVLLSKPDQGEVQVAPWSGAGTTGPWTTDGKEAKINQGPRQGPLFIGFLRPGIPGQSLRRGLRMLGVRGATHKNLMNNISKQAETASRGLWLKRSKQWLNQVGREEGGQSWMLKIRRAEGAVPGHWFCCQAAIRCRELVNETLVKWSAHLKTQRSQNFWNLQPWQLCWLQYLIV